MFLKTVFLDERPKCLLGPGGCRAGEIVTKAIGPGVNPHMGAPPKGFD